MGRGITIADMKRWGWVKDGGDTEPEARPEAQEKPIDWENIVPDEKNASLNAIRATNPDTDNSEHGR